MRNSEMRSSRVHDSGRFSDDPMSCIWPKVMLKSSNMLTFLFPPRRRMMLRGAKMALPISVVGGDAFPRETFFLSAHYLHNPRTDVHPQFVRRDESSNVFTKTILGSPPTYHHHRRNRSRIDYEVTYVKDAETVTEASHCHGRRNLRRC